jgi:hypothetical protein
MELPQKNREENKFSSRVEVRDCGLESVRDRDQARWAVSASFSSLLFSSLLSFFSLLPSTIPPFQSAVAVIW